MQRIYVPLQQDESKALLVLANVEKRHPKQQAALLIRQGLERAGLLAASTDGQVVADVKQK